MWVTFSTITVSTRSGAWAVFEVTRDYGIVDANVAFHDVHGIVAFQAEDILLFSHLVGPDH
jgi:hypothetical protein